MFSAFRAAVAPTRSPSPRPRTLYTKILPPPLHRNLPSSTEVDEESWDFTRPVILPALPSVSVAGDSSWELVSAALVKTSELNQVDAAGHPLQPRHDALSDLDYEEDEAMSDDDDKDDE